MSDVQARKAHWLEKQGMRQIGVVLAPAIAGERIAIVADAAVRWLSAQEFHDLMRPGESG